MSTANARTHRVTRHRPVDVLAEDRAAMGLLPPIGPTVGTSVATRLGRDYYVAFGGSSYSAHPDAIGRLITVTADLHRIGVLCENTVVADHPRLWGTGGLLTDPAHLSAAKVQRAQYNTIRSNGGGPVPVEVEVADLGAYDTVFGTGEVA